MAASKVCEAASRLVKVVHEVIRRHEAVPFVPDAALRLRCAYSVFLLSLKAWAEGTSASMEALADGMTPQYAYVQGLMKKYESAWAKAQTEEKELLRRLGMTAGEMQAWQSQMLRSLDAAQADSWQPEV